VAKNYHLTRMSAYAYIHSILYAVIRTWKFEISKWLCKFHHGRQNYTRQMHKKLNSKDWLLTKI